MLSASDRFSQARRMWWEQLETLVRQGRRSPGTLDTYRSTVKDHVAPAFDEVRLGEMTTPLGDTFIIGTGPRIGETLGVRWPDLDLDKGLLSVERTVVRVKGEGLQANGLKTDSSARVLVLPSWCVRMLKERRLSASGDGPVFPDGRGGFRDRNNAATAFRQVRAGTEFEWVTPHTYRRTVATMLDGAGQSARVIADQLGHSRVSMTQDYYMGRKAVSRTVADVLDLHDPDRTGERQGTPQ